MEIICIQISKICLNTQMVRLYLVQPSAMDQDIILKNSLVFLCWLLKAIISNGLKFQDNMEQKVKLYLELIQ